MRLIAGLSWYMESPTFLAATVSSLAKLGVDHLIAVDGAYGLFPKGQGTSRLLEAETIAAVCDSLDMGYTLHTRNSYRKYLGNEVEKRNLLFNLAKQDAEMGVDWFFSIDADEVVDSVMGDPKALLAATDLDAATCSYIERIDVHKDEMNKWLATHFYQDCVQSTPNVRFFRLQEDFRVVSNHYTYVSGQGDDEKILWSAGTRRDDVQTLNLNEYIKLENKNKRRDKHRSDLRWQYYETRDQTLIETRYDKEDLVAKDFKVDEQAAKDQMRKDWHEMEIE